MSTTTSPANNLYRLGGAAAILGLLLMFGYAVLPMLMGIAILVMAVFYFAFSRAQSSTLSLVAVALAAGGGILMLLTNPEPSPQYNLALLAGPFLPALLAGLAANSQAGFPRALAIIGIVAGVAGLLNFLVVTIGGGDYTDPNNPALAPFIWATYLPAALGAVWLVWEGVLLFRKA